MTNHGGIGGFNINLSVPYPDKDSDGRSKRM